MNTNTNKKTVTSLSFFVTLTAALLISACATQSPTASQPPINVAMTQAMQAKISPDAAITMLKEGNQRFISGSMLKRDLPAQVKTSGRDGQFPFASIVSCIDSRSDPALVFDQGIGDLFTARVAGNIVNEDILGSLEYAAKVAGSKVIIILGHSHCGAVKGACDNANLGNLTQLVAKIMPAVKATPDNHGSDRSSKNHHFVDAVAEMNVKMTVKAVTEKSVVLKEMADKGQIKIVGAMLDVETGKIDFY
ncbi:carbonic anhydrase family protein [Undibacterium pigrum]|uniref:Carbonic anhydrase n=1 Tax=Undibacterium pigrum TaxID=401470 RepID=A0A318K284_9BURK|nr:carbonic anhydrase family protein [Undibacterium pigrum]PXX47414.1 carbonic anhydrase [Undibacterium pigrum]